MTLFLDKPLFYPPLLGAEGFFGNPVFGIFTAGKTYSASFVRPCRWPSPVSVHAGPLLEGMYTEVPIHPFASVRFPISPRRPFALSGL